MMNPFGFSPFGMGMGMGMFGFRPMIPLSTIFVMGTPAHRLVLAALMLMCAHAHAQAAEISHT